MTTHKRFKLSSHFAQKQTLYTSLHMPIQPPQHTHTHLRHTFILSVCYSYMLFVLLTILSLPKPLNLMVITYLKPNCNLNEVCLHNNLYKYVCCCTLGWAPHFLLFYVCAALRLRATHNYAIFILRPFAQRKQHRVAYSRT